MVGTIGFSLVTALIMAAITLKAKHRADTIIGVIWAIGMALGIILLDLTPGYNVDLMSYLFGSILTVPDSDIWMMLVVGVAILGIVIFFYNDYLALSYDEEFAQIRGVNVKPLYFLMITMLAIGIVMIIQVVGNNSGALSAQQIYDTPCRSDNINRVTVYRILDLLVEKGLVDRISGGGRFFVYGLAPSKNHPAHPHFFCKNCGNLECLNPLSL
jgi:hypothetical protein